MERITPIVRGQGKAFRFTFMDADTQEVLDTTDWVMTMQIGRNRSQPDDLYTDSATPDEANAAQGVISMEVPDTFTSEIKGGQVIMRFRVDPNTGTQTLVFFCSAPVMNEADYEASLYESNNGSNDNTPTYVSGEEPQEIKVIIRNDIDPTFDVGVLVKFDEIDPDQLEYLEALQADVTQKHSEVMGA